MLLVNDRQLLDHFRAGQRQALQSVYLHYRPRVMAFLRRGFSFKSGDRWLRFRGYPGAFELAQATHETMARAFLPAARTGYDGLRPFSDYLLGIGRNYVLNELRRHEHLVVVGGSEDLPEWREAGEAGGASGVGEAGEGTRIDPEPTLEEREVARLLTTFQEAATPVERQLFGLRFTDGQGQDEAAAAMGLSRIQVRRLEYKVKERLLTFLKKHGYLAQVPRSILGARLGMVLA